MTLSRVGNRVRASAIAPAVRLATSRATIRAAADGSRHAPIFLVGAPRTGSTILYQALTNYFDVLYIDNLACRWGRAPYFGFLRSARRFGNAPHNSFGAVHGSTTDEGLHAPSECGGFWYRWLPADRHFIDYDDVTPKVAAELRREVHAAQNCYDRPLVFKNLNVGQRLRLIAASFAEARIVVMRRDTAATVASILRARADLAVGAGRWWSTKPLGYEQLLDLPERTMVERQVAAIEAQIRTDLELFPAAQRFDVRYEDLSAAMVTDLGARLGLGQRPGGALPHFRNGGDR